MDVRCPKCGEPWDSDELHDVPGMTYKAAWAAFQKRGCAIFGASHSEQPDKTAAAKARILYAMLGDDVDGAASILSE